MIPFKLSLEPKFEHGVYIVIYGDKTVYGDPTIEEIYRIVRNEGLKLIGRGKSHKDIGIVSYEEIYKGNNALVIIHEGYNPLKNNINIMIRLEGNREELKSLEEKYDKKLEPYIYMHTAYDGFDKITELRRLVDSFILR